MTDVIRLTRKAFTWSVVLLTIVWSIGVAALIPAVAQGATPDVSAGDLIKFPGSPAVYLLNADLQRVYFPNSDVFHSWFPDFSGVIEMPADAVSNFPAPSMAPFGVNYRPGSMVVRLEISPDVFAVEPGNKLAKVGSEAVAKALYGDRWNVVGENLAFIGDVFWPNYAGRGADLSEAKPHDGMLVKKAGETDLYFVKDGALSRVEGSLSAAAAGDVRTVTAEVFSTLQVAAGTVTAGSVVQNPAQTVAGQTPSPTPTPTPAAGNLSVSLSANTPAGGNVPINVDNVVFSKFVFTAGAGADVKVNAVRIDRRGLGATGDFTSVTLYDGPTKLGTSKSSWTSDGYMNYNIPGGWTVPAGTSKTLTMVARLDTAGTYNALGVGAVTLSAGTVSGLPVFGNEVTGVNVSVGTVTVTGQGTTSQTKNIGINDVTLAQFRLALSGVEDGKLMSVRLKNKGTASDSDVANLYLFRGAEQLAGPVQMSGDYVSFELSEAYALLKSKNTDFKVMGDIAGGDARTIEFVLDDTTDLAVVGNIYNTNMSVTAGDFDGTADAGTTITTVDGAELNIAFSSVALDTPDDRDDVEFGRLTLSAGATDVKITETIFKIDETDGNSDASDNKDVDEFEMVDNADGSLYTGAMTDGGDGNAADETWTFDDEIYLVAGQSRVFILRGDLPTGIGANDAYKVTMTVNTTNIVAETVPEGDAVNNFSVGSIAGKIITVKAPEVTIRSTDMNAQDAVINQEDVVIFNGSLEANPASDARIERMRFEGGNTAAGNITVVATNMDADNWSEVGFYTWNKATEAWDLQELLTSADLTDGELDFNSLDFVVAAGSVNKMNFLVKGKLRNVFTANTTVHLQLDTVTARDTDNDTITARNSAGTAIASGAELEIVGSTTLRAQGVLYVSIRNADSGFNKDRILLAGDSAWVGKLRLRADFEDVLVRDLKLTNSTADDEDSAESVCLYSDTVADAAHLVACTSPDSNDIAFFNDIDKVITQGTHDWYIYVNSRRTGDGASETADSHDVFEMRVSTSSDDVVARGQASGEDLAFGDVDSTADAGEIVLDGDLDGTFDEVADATTAYTKKFDVAGSKITDVDLVSSFGGETVDTVLNGTGTYTLAILKVVTAANQNADANGEALKLGFGRLTFDVDKFASTTLSGGTIRRINGTQAAAALDISGNDGVGESGDWFLASATSSLAADGQVDAGQTAYFVVKGTINALNGGTGIVDHIRVSLESFDSGTNNIDWIDGYEGTTGTDFDYLRLDKSSITGTRLAESL